MQLSDVIPGFGVGREWSREGLAKRLIDLWLRDSDTATDLAELPWVRNGLTGWDSQILSALVEVAMIDIGLGKRVAGLAWMSGSVAEVEWRWLTGLGGIALQDLELAKTVANFQWIIEGPPGYESLPQLASIASEDLELAWTIVELPWFTDGVTEGESITLFYLDRIVSTDLGFAWTIVGLPWFTDSVTEGEWSTVAKLGSIASEDLDLALWLSKLPLSEGLENLVLKAFYLLVANEPDVVSQITSQPWVQDEIDEKEMAFMVALLGEASSSTYGNYALFEALLEGHYTQSKTVSLPVTGDVNIWVFQSAPFSSGEDVATVIEEIARTIEGFVGSPLPTTDIIVLIENLPQDLLFPAYAGVNHGSHVKINREYGKDLGQLMFTIIHELAHYYDFGPRWFNESFAHLMEQYVNLRMGIHSIPEVRAKVSMRVERYCSREEIATIRHSLFVDQHFRLNKPGQCTRALGLRFLHHAFEFMGEERIATAIHELNALELNPLQESDEEAIYRTLLSNTPPNRHEDFRDLYRRLHGGSHADSDMGRADDHGDSEETATKIAARQVVMGNLDYGFDFDYFKLQAEENEKFIIDVAHETLGTDNVMVFTSIGERSLGVKSKVRVTSGALVQWVAPSTDSYYFAVLSLRGETGRYTLQITHVPDVPDDYGDNEAMATDISVGEKVHGIIDDVFDLDYFRLPVLEGRVYSVKVTGAALQDCCVARGGDQGEFVWDGSGFAYREIRTGERYLVVHGGHENTGAYVLEVSSE